MEKKENLFLNNPSEEINARYVNEINMYLASPCPACTKQKALKLLKKFSRMDWREFWFNDIAEYLPAVSEGTMKLKETRYPHDEAILYARNLISELDVKVLARDFLFGVAHNAPEYRTALACYYYIKNLPEHSFSEECCAICRYTSKHYQFEIPEPKMDFWHINGDMERFYINAWIPSQFNLNTAILYLEEYLKQARPKTNASDIEFFNSIISEIEASSEKVTPGTLCKILKGGILNFMTIDQINAFIDMLGYLNILHKPGTYGVTVRHTQSNEMELPNNERTNFAYPIYNWKRKYGIDYDSINYLFGDLH